MKSQLYFPLAYYLRFFASIVLHLWKPKIIAVVGSAGKTTTLLLVNELLRTTHSVYYSKKANSAIGIPLNILGLTVHHYSTRELLRFILLAPLRTLSLMFNNHTEHYYLVEADADRPGEMEFLTSFLQPHIVVWVSSFATHTQNFTPLVRKGIFRNEVETVAAEFAKSITMNPRLEKAYVPSEKTITSLLKKNKKVKVVTPYVCDLPYLAPPEFYSIIGIVREMAEYFKIEGVDTVISSFRLPPGRCSVFKGIKRTTIIDSSYNSSPDALIGMLSLLSKQQAKRKIAVLGDMRELGVLSKDEHERVAKELLAVNCEHVVLVGPAMKEYVEPLLLENGYTTDTLHSYDNTYQAGLFIKETLLRRGDCFLVKASQNTLYFEIIVELLLEDQADVAKLCRREMHWEHQRARIKKRFYDTLK